MRKIVVCPLSWNKGLRIPVRWWYVVAGMRASSGVDEILLHVLPRDGTSAVTRAGAPFLATPRNFADAGANKAATA